MNPDEQDNLWRLLGKAREPVVSPFFARNVIRRIRGEERGTLTFFAFLRRRWHLAAATVSALLVAGFVLLDRPSRVDSVTLLAQQVALSPDYQVIKHLDELLESETNAIWLESSVY